jgi:predicted Zn-dependent protease
MSFVFLANNQQPEGVKPMKTLSRREFLQLTGVGASGIVLGGCAVNPVTGENQLMLMSESDEISTDQQFSAQQFAADYGVCPTASVNTYLDGFGKSLAAKSHRPGMPYSFRAVNASNVNAYAFPGGSIAATRGILLKLEDEASLAALLGHEVGHVCCRHAAQQQTKGMMVNAGVAGLSYGVKAYGAKDDVLALTNSIGSLGSGALLAKYSRDNERQADQLGMEYAVRTGYAPAGMISLMDILRGLGGSNPSVIEQMMASHPMSEERYQTAVARAKSAEYAKYARAKAGREAYMEAIKPVRAQAAAVTAIQKGDAALASKQAGQALAFYQQALKSADGDYEALLKAGKSCVALEKTAEASRYVDLAKQSMPGGAQALQMSGVLALARNDFSRASADFNLYEKTLPNDPQNLFLRGRAAEGAGQQSLAADCYDKYLKATKKGPCAEHAYSQMVSWGVYKQPQK